MMKDRLFRLLYRMYRSWLIRITRLTYWYYSIRKTKHLKKISQKEHGIIKQYWKDNYGKSIAIREYKWYKAKGIKLTPRLIPDYFWHTVIEPKYTDFRMLDGFSDKNYFEFIIGRENSPIAFLHCINNQILNKQYTNIDVEESVRILKDINEKEVICKPSIDSGGGRGVQIIQTDIIDKDLILGLKKQYSGNFIIQGMIKQMDFFSQFNRSSINSIRLISFLNQGKYYVLSAFLRVGGEGSRVDNMASGGYLVPIDISNGYLKHMAFKENPNTKELTQISISEKNEDLFKSKIPSWEKIVDVSKNNHYKLSHFGIINWDIAVNTDGEPIIIEYNLFDASPSFHQIGNGPIFGDLTDDIIKQLRRK